MLLNAWFVALAVAGAGVLAQRPMENLGRGVTAIRASSSSVLVSWRSLGLDDSKLGFNVYRNGTKINSSVLTGGTNIVDTSANLAVANSYTVRPVLNGVEQAASSAFTLPANNAVEPVVRIPLRAGPSIKFVWVGDLDGDGEYDYVIDRQTDPQRIEAYSSKGVFLWQVSLGPNSSNQDNISPGSATISVGNWDGVTVYDFDSDGRAEVAIKIANGVVFGDGKTFSGSSNNNEQWIAFLDGRTGALRASSKIPTDYLSAGPLAARFAVGYLDGTRPYLTSFMKNRNSDKSFNLMHAAWTFNGTTASMAWKWLRGSQDCPDGHNSRVIDVDGDGKDEVVEIGYVLNGNGTLRYALGPKGINHGDRYHIAKMDPSRSGLQGYGIQQDNPSKLLEYYYDATNGNILWTHYGTEVSDVARGMAADIDPRYPGMEVWSFSGVYNAKQNVLTEPNTALRPWPHLGLWWDGDLLTELYNDGKIEKWNHLAPTATNAAPRLQAIWTYGGTGNGVYPLMIGDIFGDWREEVITSSAAFDQLIIFSTNIATDYRIYTLAHNPAYRNDMTVKGYIQSHHLDYFLGNGMTLPPPRPNIRYVGSTGGGTSSTSTSVPTSTSSGGGNGCTTPQWGQCGGDGFTGCTTCASPYVCTFSNQWYSQCL